MEVSFAGDGEEGTLVRQAYLGDVEALRAGPMAAAPTGDGFEATLEGFAVE